MIVLAAISGAVVYLAVSVRAAKLIGGGIALADARDSRPLATVTDIADHRPVAS